MPLPLRPRPLDLAVVLGSAALCALTLALSGWRDGWLVENGPVEMVQTTALLSATILFSRAALRQSGWDGLTVLGLACMSLLFLVRETPRCTSDFADIGPCFPDEAKLLGYALPAILLLALPAIKRDLWIGRVLRHGWSAFAAAVRAAWPVAPIAAFVLAAQAADGWYLPAVEEGLETLAYALMTLWALAEAARADRVSVSRDSARSLPVRGSR